MVNDSWTSCNYFVKGNLQKFTKKIRQKKQPILPEEQIPHGAGGLDGTVMQRVRSYTGATFIVGTSTRVGYTD